MSLINEVVDVLLFMNERRGDELFHKFVILVTVIFTNRRVDESVLQIEKVS